MKITTHTVVEKELKEVPIVMNMVRRQRTTVKDSCGLFDDILLFCPEVVITEHLTVEDKFLFTSKILL